MTDSTVPHQNFEKEQVKLEKAGRLHWFHWAVVLGSLVLTLGAWYFADTQVALRTESRFEHEAERVVALVQERMQKYEDALWGGVAAIHSQSHGIDYEEWKRFSATLRIEEKYPGINGIGVIYYVPENKLQDYLARERADRPDYAIHPPHEQGEYWPITYIEPVEMNMKAVGLDMAHETNRYTAAQQARDTGDARITGPITLVQDAEQTPGFLFYAPFYEDRAYDTVKERQENFVGLVYAPFIFKKLMLGTLQAEKRFVSVQIKDGDYILYDEHVPAFDGLDSKPLFEKIVTVNMYGRTWAFDIWSTLSFREQTHNSQPLMILFGGLVIDSLLLLLFILLARANRQAIGYADRMTANYQDKAKELEQANAELEDFSYRTSHDLRAPLVSSIALLDISAESLQKNDREQAIASMEHAQQSLTKLKNLTEDILNLTKTKNMFEDAQDVDVKEMVEDTLEALSNAEEFQKIKIIKDLGFDQSLNVKKTRLYMIIENLISNAIKYHDPDQKEPYIKISSREEDGNFVFEIEDNGLGIPEEQRKNLFAMFKRFHPKTSYGSGLGLYMVRKSADILNGTIDYKDNGEGSIFTLTIPLQGNTE